MQKIEILKKKFLKKCLRILKYGKPHYKIAIHLFLISIFLTIVSLISPYLIKILIDDILISKNYTYLIYLMLTFILIFIMKTILQIYASYKSTQFTEYIVFDVKSELFNHIESLDLGFFYNKQVGDIMYRLEQDVYGIDSFIGLVIDDFLMNILTGIVILIICLNLSWKVTLSSLAFFPLFILVQKHFGKRIQSKRRSIEVKSAELLSFLEETISAIKTIKAFLMEKIKYKAYSKRSKKLIKHSLNITLLQSFAGSLIGLITFTPLLIILWYGSHQVMAGYLSIGTLIALYTYIGKLFGPISTLGSLDIGIKNVMVSVDRVFQFLNKKPRIVEAKNPIELDNIKSNINFNNVNFNYLPGDNILSNINIDINKGEKIGIVGESGSGKTTIANLLCRFFDPKSGSIMIDGINLHDISLKSLRKNIGLVSQEAVMLNATIKDNIRFGKYNATQKEIERAAKLANIHKFITRQPKGYNTIVGERGTKLSGGQKQRIAIARVLLKDPPIIIFDEGTSSLDTKTEKIIQRALEYFSKNKTVLIIAHRLSTLRDTNKIFVLSNKSISESGTFSQLIKNKQDFYMFYHNQERGIDNFRERAAREIKIAQLTKLPITMAILQIANLKELMTQTSEEQSLQIIDNIYTALEYNLKEEELVTLSPISNDLFYFLFPETDKNKANKRIKDMILTIKNKINQDIIPEYLLITNTNRMINTTPFLVRSETPSPDEPKFHTTQKNTSTEKST